MTRDVAAMDQEAVARSPVTLAWRRIDETPGHAYGRVQQLAGVVIYEGWEVAASVTQAWAVRFRLIVDAVHVARALEVDADGPRGLRRLSVRRDPRGHWWADGKRRSDLDACSDIDVAATPLTNTPTIRRLGLAVGESAEITVAWVHVPRLSIEATPQGYDRLARVNGIDRYRFRTAEGAGSELTTDSDGLVRDYERLAERILRR